MTKTKDNFPETQRASISLKLGRAIDFQADTELTSTGLLSVAALVSGILLSTSVLVVAAIRESRRAPAASAPLLQKTTSKD